MKRTIVIVMAAAAISALAAPVTPEQALERLNKGSQRAKVVGKVERVQTDYSDALYVFNTGGGAVIAPADDMLPSVLVELDEPIVGDIAPNLDFLLQHYVAAVRDASRGSLRKVKSPAEGRHDTGILGEAHWSQGAPYNAMCPGPYTGCVATAMAQVMYGHKYPERFDWDNMLPSYRGGDYTQEQGMAVAELMAEIGREVDMDYYSYQSEADEKGVPPAFIKFGYDKSVVLRRHDYEKDWDGLMYNELLRGNTVFMTGYGQTWEDAHAYNCDGYRVEDGKYHFNLGWGGQYDGWFDLRYVDVYGMVLNSRFYAVTGVSVGETDRLFKYLLARDTSFSQTEYRLGDKMVMNAIISNYSAQSTEYIIGMRLESEGGLQSVRYIGRAERDMTYYSGGSTLFEIELPEDLAPGVYKGRLMHLDDDGEWRRVYVAVWANQFVWLTVGDDGSVSLSYPTAEENEADEPDAEVTGEPDHGSSGVMIETVVETGEPRYYDVYGRPTSEDSPGLKIVVRDGEKPRKLIVGR